MRIHNCVETQATFSIMGEGEAEEVIEVAIAVVIRTIITRVQAVHALT